jgi:hypothetical protein
MAVNGLTTRLTLAIVVGYSKEAQNGIKLVRSTVPCCMYHSRIHDYVIVMSPGAMSGGRRESRSC